MELKVGDRVTVKDGYFEQEVVGKVGTIRYDSENDSKPFTAFGIEFDEDIGGHAGRGLFKGKEGHCWFVPKYAVEKKHDKYPTITISTDGKHTTVKLCKDGKTLKQATVSLYYKDKFSLSVGAEEAVKKLFGSQKRVKEVKRNAKVGEYIKIVNAGPDGFLGQNYKNGDVFLVKDADYSCFGGTVKVSNLPSYIDPEEYVVLENYKPEKGRK